GKLELIAVLGVVVGAEKNPLHEPLPLSWFGGRLLQRQIERFHERLKITECWSAIDANRAAFVSYFRSVTCRASQADPRLFIALSHFPTQTRALELLITTAVDRKADSQLIAFLCHAGKVAEFGDMLGRHKQGFTPCLFEGTHPGERDETGALHSLIPRL